MVPTVAAFLLLSIGGDGIFAAPVTVPALILLIRTSHSRAYRVSCSVVCVLTLAEVGWFVWYSATGSPYVEPTPLVSPM